MKYIVSAPRSQAARRLLAGGALMGVLLAAGAAAIGDVSPEAKRSGAAASRSLSLAAGPNLRLSANQWECGLASFGDVCANVFNSPTGAGGTWPIGTPNAYIFNTGMQVGGISANGAYAWANDTLGAFFFDASGTHPSGAAWTNIYNSLDPTDLCGDADGDGYDDCWGMADYNPSASFPTLDDLYITNADIYEENLLGRANISQQDSWVQYWDGDPTRITDRQHPMGLLVTQRSLAWNYPLGNESVLYFIFEIRNVTNTPEFQIPNELAFFSADPAGIPDEGITFNEVYAGFSTDMDVADAGSNFSSAILPFELGISYHGGFDAPAFSYPPSVFFPPFFTTAPGIVGVKYLKSPVNPETGEEVGLTRFSITLNGGPPGSVGDAGNDKQLWRYLSGFLNPALGDAPCSVAPEVDTGQIATSEQSVCFVYQSPFDTRFFQSSGPFTLAPGQQVTVVVAYLAAATVQTMPDGSLSGLAANASAESNPPGTPSFHPGYPSSRGCDASGNNCSVVVANNPVKPLERGAGWAGYTGPAPSGRAGGALEGPENKLPLFDETGSPYVQVVQGSLLGKALVAQTIFDNKFLLGFAPIQPTAYTVSGNNSVTVLWERSLTEEIGDPFFAVAGDSASALYNPNYRSNDVEAYAIWRSVGQEQPEVIAFFDYANTTFTDLTCETVLPDEDLHDNSSAPAGSIGFSAGEECPEDFEKTQSINMSMYFNNGSIGGGPGGGVVRLADSTALGVAMTQVGVDDFGGYPGLIDTGVPFAFNDLSVTNNFTYFYGVQAVDLNSLASGPYSLSSSRILSRTTPNNDTQNLDVASAVEVFVSGDDGVPLDSDAPIPNLDPETGIFDGPMPPTDGMAIDLAPSVPRLQGAFEVEARIDSFMADENATACIGGIYAFQQSCGVVYLTVGGESVVLPIWIPNYYGFTGSGTTQQQLASVAIPFDAAALESYGIPEGTGSQGVAVATINDAIEFINWEGQQNRRGITPRTLHGGARWFSGTEEVTPDPTAYIKVGHLDEVDSVWAPIHHTAQCNGCGVLPNSGSVQYWGYVLAGLGRAADFRVTWNGGGISVRDVTHNVDVPFSSNVGSSWGFLNDDPDLDGTTSWWDFFCIDNIKQHFEDDIFGQICPDAVPLYPTATIHSVALNTEGDPTTGSTANGFTLVLNSMRWFFVANSTPPDGTVWTLRAYTGTVNTTEGDDTDDPSGYEYHFTYGTGEATGQRPAIIPGMAINWVSSDATTVQATWDLSLVHTVPDPYLATSQYDLAPTSKNLQFVNLPPKATIRIYTLTGVLVNQIDHEDSTGGGRAVWDVRNWSQQFVASGVYFFHVVTPAGDERVGKFTIVNFAGQN
jgi:hypothetical protein